MSHTQTRKTDNHFLRIPNNGKIIEVTMDRLNAMQAFARVVEAGSFTKAAETLQMSKTSVTQLVQQLEVRLRVKLLNRTTRQVNVTAEGAIYYEKVIRLLADVDDAEAIVSSASKHPRGRLRVDVPSPLARLVLIPALPAFCTRYPDIQIDLGANDHLVNLIEDSVDCVIRGGEISSPSLVARRIGSLPMHFCAAPSYLERVGKPLHPSELENPRHATIGFRSSRTGKALSYDLHNQGESIKVQGRHVLTVDDGNAYLAAGLAGLGILCLPEYMSRPHLENHELIPLFADWNIDPMPLYLAFPSNRHMSAKLRVFIDWLVDWMPDRASWSV